MFVHVLSCVKIYGYLLEIINSLTLGQINMCMGPMDKKPKMVFDIFDF